GDNVVIYFGLVFFIASFVVLALSTANWHVVVAGVLAGLGYGTLMPAVQAVSVGVVDKSGLRTAFSPLFPFVVLGVGFGPFILGAVPPSIGFGPMFGGLAVVGVIAGIYYLCSHARTERAKHGVVKYIGTMGLAN